MSLEQAIEANTAAIRDLIVALNTGKVVAGTEAARADADTEAAQFYEKEEDKKRKAALGELAAKKPTPALRPDENPVSSQSGALPQSEPESAAQEPIAVDLMKDVVPVFGKLCVAKGRDAGAAILAKWKVAKLSQVPSDKLGDVLADIQQAAA